jgi:hypothetical protein
MTLVLRMLRLLAVTMAIAGVIDPSWTTSRQAPVVVAVHGPATASGTMAAAAIQERLSRALAGRVSFAADLEPSARIIVGDADVPGDNDVPTSVVTTGSSASYVRIVNARSPAPVPVGWLSTVEVSIEAEGMAGTSSPVILEHDGLELARREHRWSQSPERATISLPFTPPSAGASRVVARVLRDGRAPSGDAGGADLTVTASARRLRILTHEPRPSWAAAFVRRALERNPAFDVATLVQLSKGLAVSAGSPPRALTLDALLPFDAVLIGAPEELTGADVDALSAFARRRGGAVIFLPDRRPSGRYLDLMPGWTFDEVLVDRPLDVVEDRDGAMKPPSGEPPKAAPGTPASPPPVSALKASELALASADVSAADGIAFARVQKGTRPAILSRRLGAGRVIVSGALDAWRYRAAEEDAFDRFWFSLIATAAMAAPPRLALEVEPEIAAPGETVAVRARIRGTEFDPLAPTLRLPAVGARIVGPGGVATPIRLWPSAEPGAFEARVRAPTDGRYVIEASAGDVTAALPLTVASDARRAAPSRRDEDVRAHLVVATAATAAATGGVVASETDLSGLEQHLRNLPPASRTERIHPTRSLVFVALFVAVACAEWALRRRRGLA